MNMPFLIRNSWGGAEVDQYLLKQIIHFTRVIRKEVTDRKNCLFELPDQLSKLQFDFIHWFCFCITIMLVTKIVNSFRKNIKKTH